MDQEAEFHNYTKIPSLMLIMRIVADAAYLTTGAMIYGNRQAYVCRARAVVYRIASEYGYTRNEIMYILNRDRTVAYNYDAAINGYLEKDRLFVALYTHASEQVQRAPHRAVLYHHPPRIKTNEDHTTIRKGECRVFEDWKGQLGWSFTAEECCEEWLAKVEAARYMESLS